MLPAESRVNRGFFMPADWRLVARWYYKKGFRIKGLGIRRAELNVRG